MWYEQLLKELDEAENKGLLKRLESPSPYSLLIQLPNSTQKDKDKQYKLLDYIKSITPEYYQVANATEGIDMQDYTDKVVVEIIFSRSLLGDDLHGMIPCDGRQITAHQYPGLFDAIESFRKAMKDHVCEQCKDAKEKETKEKIKRLKGGI